MPDVGDMVAARIVGTCCGQPLINDFSFAVVGAFATWRDLTDQLSADFETALELSSPTGPFMVQRSSQYVINSFEVIDIFPGVAPMNSYPLGTAGTEVTDALPPNDALAVTFRSDFKGPSGRGRVYLGGYPEAAQINGFWQADPQDAASGLCSALDTQFGELAGSSSFRWAILHKVSGGVRIIPPEIKPVMSFTVHNEVRSLGRRAMGRRIHRTRTSP